MNWIRLHVPFDRVGDRLGQRRLAGAGDVVDEQVPLAEQAHQGEGDLVVLALDDLFDVLEQGVEPVAEPLGLLVGCGLHVVSLAVRVDGQLPKVRCSLS